MRIRLMSATGAVLLIASAVPAFAGPHLRRGPTAQRLTKGHGGRSSSKVSAAPRISMSPERATELQAALIRSGYMSGSPSGVWDSPSQAAMEKLQADNGWQTKLVPDSRAIIKLGLGPNNAAGAGVEASEVSPASIESGAHSSNQ